MAYHKQDLHKLLRAGHTLAIADSVLIDPDPGTLVARTNELLTALKNATPAEQVCRTLIRLGMNFAGRDAMAVGYPEDECDKALKMVLAAMEEMEKNAKDRMSAVVKEFLADMKSVNQKDSLLGLLSERIEKDLSGANPGCSFLSSFKKYLQGSIYWRMISGGYSKFGNDYARGLEYLRHLGFCQVSTNPVLAAKAFDEDPALTVLLQAEIEKHDEWKRSPEAYADDMAMAATLIALWPNLMIFRPLALHVELKDYMVSFQLNPNIAHQAAESIKDAYHAYSLALNFIKNYDELLGLGERSGKVGPCIVFKVSGGHEASRKITKVLNADGIGTNNTVVYNVAQEVQLILDAFEGKARALKNGKQVIRTYETNMGGRFVSHLREMEAEKIFIAAEEKAGDDAASKLLNMLSDHLNVDSAALKKIPSAPVDAKARMICSFKYLKSLNVPAVLQAAEASGRSAESVKLLEEDLKKAGTLVARRVYWIFFSPQNRPKWVGYLQRTYDLNRDQAAWLHESMDVLPASKRIPEDSYHALGSKNMCHTEFPNHTRAVQVYSETDTFSLNAFKESILGTYEPGVVERLSRLPDFVRGYHLTPTLKNILMNQVGIAVDSWQTGGLEPEKWSEFGAVVKTSEEFSAAYNAFADRCVKIAKEINH